MTDSDGIGFASHQTLFLAQEQVLSVYDAAYLELAIRLGAPLATRDTALRSAATRLGIATLP